MISTPSGKRDLSGRPNKMKAVLPVSEFREGLACALQDLYGLLERYAPSWYTSEHREMAQHGLRKGGKVQAKALIALHQLLQDYSPTWYREEHHQSAERGLGKAKGLVGKNPRTAM